MFTGIIESLGHVVRVNHGADGARITLRLEGGGDLGLGESVAVNGACLTVAALSGDSWSADLSTETLRRTMLGALRPSAVVHVERSLRVGERIGGHFVQGHVDEVGRVRRLDPDGFSRTLEVDVSVENRPLLAEKGSVAVAGVSLTVASLTESGFRVSLVSYTLEKTTLGALRAGDAVNVEFDVLAKYVASLVQPMRGIDHELLAEQGYL